MMKSKNILILGVTAGLMYGCLGPQTYFSNVFNTAYDLYFPVQDTEGKPVMNYKVIADIATNEENFNFTLFFFETGMSLTSTTPATVEEVLTTETITAIYDYQEEGIFASRYFGNNTLETEKVFSNFEEDAFDIVDTAIETVETNFTEEIKSIINNQATNLIIGGQPETQDIKKYTLPVAQFVDLNTFEDIAGFVPSDLTVEVTFVTSTNETTIEVSASSPTENYQISLNLSSYDAVLATDHLLSSTAKSAYEGYSA